MKKKKDPVSMTKEELLSEVESLKKDAELRELSEANRKRAEEVARAAREYAESIVATVREPLVILDAELRVVTANRSFYSDFHVNPEESEGQLIYELGNRQWDIPKLRELLEEILPKNTKFDDFEVEHDFETIGRRTMLLNARRIYGEANKTQMVLLAIEDITASKLAQELKRSNEDLQQFAYAAAHDLQEPLRMVSSYTQMLATRYKGRLDDDADQFISFAVDGANRMQGLIKDLLEYSRIQSRGVEYEQVDCHSILGGALANLSKTIDENQAMVTNDDLPTVEADGTQLMLLFQNLIANAIKFRGEEPPRIHVSAERKEGEWVFSVRDNGIGIELQYKERIFLIFQRLHARDKYGGTGIGLSICRRIVQRHGGRIWMESEPGNGSIFYFTIPFKKRQG